MTLTPPTPAQLREAARMLYEGRASDYDTALLSVGFSASGRTGPWLMKFAESSSLLGWVDRRVKAMWLEFIAHCLEDEAENANR